VSEHKKNRNYMLIFHNQLYDVNAQYLKIFDNYNLEGKEDLN
jgi:hypothetical protein